MTSENGGIAVCDRYTVLLLEDCGTFVATYMYTFLCLPGRANIVWFRR